MNRKEIKHLRELEAWTVEENLRGLQECFMEGEDFCSAGTIDMALNLIHKLSCMAKLPKRLVGYAEGYEQGKFDAEMNMLFRENPPEGGEDE